LRGSRKLAAAATQTLRLLIASFRLEPQRFGDIRSFYAHYNFNETQVLGTWRTKTCKLNYPDNAAYRD